MVETAIPEAISETCAQAAQVFGCQLYGIDLDKDLKSLCVLVDKDSEAPTLQQLEAICQHLQLKLPKIWQQHYRLEVSSPGLDRPLLQKTHFQAACGRRIEVQHQQEGRTKTTEGFLEHSDEHGIALKNHEHSHSVTWQDLISARLIHDYREGL